MKSLRCFLLCATLIISLFSSVSVMGQENQSEDVLKESLSDVYTVVGLGLGGAILGLSTLSFVEEPKEHLKNIVVGGAVGVIIGVGLVAWGQATNTKELYQQSEDWNQEFSTSERYAWHSIENNKFSSESKSSVNQLNFNFRF